MGERLPKNAPGRFYVSDDCVYCGVCNDIAPDIFGYDEENNTSYVKRQPETEEEIELVKEAIENCPTESIIDSEEE